MWPIWGGILFRAREKQKPGEGFVFYLCFLFLWSEAIVIEKGRGQRRKNRPESVKNMACKPLLKIRAMNQAKNGETYTRDETISEARLIFRPNPLLLADRQEARKQRFHFLPAIMEPNRFSVRTQFVRVSITAIPIGSETF